MGASTVHSSSGDAWRLASEQHGVLSRRQLLELGFTPHAVRHRVSTGRLHRVGRGVYAVGRPDLTIRGQWMAAVLGCGPRAALSHRSAAALWGIGRPPGTIEVSVPATSRPRRLEVQIFRRTALDASDVTRRDGIPTTGIVRTLMDIALKLDRPRLERAINEADRLDLIDPESLAASVDGYGRCPGAGRLRAILGEHAFRLTDSELERRFIWLVDGIGMRLPLTGQRMNGFKVDFHWPELGLVVETDGLRYHRTPAQQARDRLRDQAHTEAGLTVLRFTHAQVMFEPGRVGRTLLAVASRLEAGDPEAARMET